MDQPATLDFEIYPNPATDVIRISDFEVLRPRLAETQAEPYALYDHSGRLVTFGTLNDQQSINVSELPVGQYAITLPRLQAVAQVFIQR